MTEAEKNKVFGINIVKGENMPAENKLSINVFIVGAVRTLIYQTSVKNGPNPEWFTNAFFMHPVRGLHLHFEIISYSKHSNDSVVVAIGDFDPRIHDIRNYVVNDNPQQIATIPINMCVLKKTQPRQDQLTNLFIRVHYMPMINFVSQKTIRVPANPTISSPFYITLDPVSPINKVSPGEDNFRLPYELSAILLNEKQQTYDVINSGNCFCRGCNHSGVNLCSTSSSLTQVLRFDPVLLSEASIKYIIIVVTSTNFLPLKQMFKPGKENPIHAMVTTWSSAEPSGQTFSTKQSILDLTSLPQQEIKISGQFPLICQDNSTVAAIAVGKISSLSKSSGQKSHHLHQKNTNDITVTFGQLTTQLPTATAQLSPQDPTSIVPIILKMCNYTNDKDSLFVDYTESSQKPKNRSHFPLLVPRSLCESLNINSNPIIIAACPVLSTFNPNHIFFSMALDFQHKHLFSCSRKNKLPVEKYLKQLKADNSHLNLNLISQKNSVELNAMKYSMLYDESQGIQVSLDNLPEDVFVVVFAIYGKKALSTDRPNIKQNKKGGKKGNNNDDSVTNMIAYSNTDALLFEVPYNFSRTKNSLIWFALYRDAFGGWGIMNIRKSYNATDENNLRLIFVDAMNQILKF